jgi:hypothetical protein
VPMIPIAAFLVGALLSILLPTVMLVALVVWYDVLVRRHGEPAETSDLGRTGAEASGGEGAADASAPVTGAGSGSPPSSGAR